MHSTSELIIMERDCDAILIPSGDPLKLIKGTHVRITQALGGDYTLFVNGNLVKISGTDADAIGKKPKEQSKINSSKVEKLVTENMVWEQLRTVYDPEIPVNIYELGLIYKIEVDDKNKVNIDMTLTSPNCPVAESLPNQVKDNIKEIHL